MPPRRNSMPVEDFSIKEQGKTIKRLLGYVFGSYKARLVVVMVCIIIAALANTAGSLFLSVLIDDYIAPLLLQDNPVFTGLLKACVIMAMIYLVGIISSFLYNRLMVVVSQGTIKRLRDEMFTHMQKLPIRYFDSNTHGDVMSRYTNDTDTLRQMISMSLPQIFSSAISIVSVACSMIVLSWQLTIVVALGVFVMLKVTGKISGKSGSFFVRQQTSLGKTNGYIEEMINGQRVVKVFCYEEEAKRKFDVLNDELCENATKANRYVNILMPINMNIGNLLYIIIAVIGGALAVSGLVPITLGVIASFLQLTRSFVMPISQVSQQFNSIVMAVAGAGRIFSLMDEEVEVDDGNVTLVHIKNVDDSTVETEERDGTWAWKVPQDGGTFEYVELKGDVRFFDVDFSYDGENQILYDLSLFAKPGQKIAFVGATGAGKTTITNLINRFYDISEGQITYDGINISDIKKNDLRHSLGIVLQDVTLFTGTVMENIRYGRLDATDEEVIAAAKLANAHNFIMKLPQGYDTELTGDGSGLSQGQRQLLSIARAAVENPPVMILDEATSSIDTRTEAIVQQGMDALMDNRTVFVIAHRLSTVHNSKAIIVLEHGNIIERGSHSELISQGGKYYQLYTGGLELE